MPVLLCYSKTGVYRGKNRLASLRQLQSVPTINVLSKNKKKYNSFSFENYHFHSREKLQYIT